MFPPENCKDAAVLGRCARVLPHLQVPTLAVPILHSPTSAIPPSASLHLILTLQDTGAFFVALFRKTAEMEAPTDAAPELKETKSTAQHLEELQGINGAMCEASQEHPISCTETQVQPLLGSLDRPKGYSPAEKARRAHEENVMMANDPEGVEKVLPEERRCEAEGGSEFDLLVPMNTVLEAEHIWSQLKDFYQIEAFPESRLLVRKHSLARCVN